MAMISTIRKQGWLVLVLVGFGILGFLIPYDAVMAMFGGGSNKVGEINGQTIDRETWQQALATQSSLFNYQNSQNHALENDVWTNLTEELVLGPEYKKLGLTVTEEELDEILFGENLSPYVLSTFYQGQNKPEFRDQIRKSFESMEPQIAEGYKNTVIAKRLREKYDGLLAHAAYTNSLDAKYSFNNANNKATVLFVVKPYASIMESEISFTNDDIEAFYNEHKNDKEYRQERSRSIAYVKIPVVANSADTAAIKNVLAETAASFKKAKGRAADSLFAAQYGGNPNSGKMKYTAGMFPEPFNTQMTADSIGKLVGPVFVENSIVYAKVTFRGTEVDSVQARHILFKEPGAVGRAKADSVRKIIIANKNFAEMAAKYGTDGTKDKGGDLGMFGRGAMVPEFENACFNAKVGDVQIVESQFGVHIYEVTKRGNAKPATYFAAISKTIEPSSNTNRAIYQSALDFIQNHGDSSSFRKGANEMYGGLIFSPDIRPEASSVQGIQSADEIISWAYTNDEGAISQPISVEGGLVVACVMEVKEKGVPTLRNVYDRMKQEVIKHKKAEKYMAMMTGSSLEEIAGKVTSTVKTAENFSMNMSNLPGSGVGEAENAVVGIAFGLPTGNISAPIEGKGGIYVLQRATDIVTVSSPDNYESNKKTANESARRSAPFLIFNSLKEGAEIEDFRFYPEN